jgi:hypothetical protein
MFRISFFVEDKNLAGILHSIAGSTFNLEVRPVVNAQMVNGRLKQKVATTLANFVAELKKAKEITADEARAAAQRSGYGPSSYSYLLQSIVKAGLIKKNGMKGNRMQYIWTKESRQ